MTNQEVATTQENDQIPAYLQGVKAAGLDNMNKDDFMLPMVKLSQALSTEISEQLGDAKAGTFFHTNAEQSLGESVRFIIASDKRKYLLLPPLGDDRKVLARADDGVHWSPPNEEFEVKIKGVKNKVVWATAPTVAESGLDKFGSSNPEDPDSKPAAVLVYEYLVYLPDFPELSPVVMSLARSQIKKAKKQLHGKIEMRANMGIPITAQIYKATAVVENGPEGTYFNYQFSADGTADEETYKTVNDIRTKLIDYKVDESKVHGEDDSSKSNLPENTEI